MAEQDHYWLLMTVAHLEEGPTAVPTAVPTTGVAATREWRRHLQERHAGGGKVGALTWPWGVGGSGHGNRAFCHGNRAF